MRYRFVRPTVPRPETWLPYLEPAYHVAQFSNFGPVAARLEGELRCAYGSPGRPGSPDRQAVLASSATAALTATLLALPVRGNVVVPSFTFPATVQAIIRACCSPLFCDIDPETWELSPTALQRLVDEQPVAAIMHVRVYGFCRPLDAIEAIADRRVRGPECRA